MSLPPPGGNGTIMRIGFTGNAAGWASRSPEPATMADTAAKPGASARVILANLAILALRVVPACSVFMVSSTRT
jgi:hypothetical protein